MESNVSPIVLGIFMGLTGTIAMDIWTILLGRIAKISLPNWGLVGRWVANLPTLFHKDINLIEPVQQETLIGWGFHYFVGLVYGVFFILIAGDSWIENPSFLPLWLFALVTIAAGWFLLQPGLGLGWAASKADAPWKGRFLGLVAHTVFGVGMWLPVAIQ